jgi:acid phosphatase
VSTHYRSFCRLIVKIDHYSQLSTVEANWGLNTLGRWDVGANVFNFVAAKTGDTDAAWTGTPSFSQMFFNTSYPGYLNSAKKTSLPPPNTSATKNGRTVLPAIKSVWGSQSANTYYTSNIEIPDGQYPPK